MSPQGRQLRADDFRDIFGIRKLRRRNTLPEKRMKRTVERPNRYFTFLRRLRADGRSNMYGAIPYLAAAFGLDRVEAFRIVCEWVDAHEMESASGRAAPKVAPPSASRAAAAHDASTARQKAGKPVKQKATRKRPRGKPRRASTPRAA